MDLFFPEASRGDPVDECKNDKEILRPGSKNLTVQLALSLILGVSAFVAFCVR